MSEEHAQNPRPLPDAFPPELAAEVRASDWKAGSVVFEEGELGDRIYVVASGEVRIEKRLDGDGGQVKTLAVCFEGDYFGEMALLERQKRFARAVAQTDARLLELSADGFGRISKANPEAAMRFFFNLARGMSMKLRDTSDQLMSLYSMGRLLLGKYPGEKEFLAKLSSELRGSLGQGWNCSAYYYNVYNDELEPVSGAPDAAAPALSGISSDKWLDDRVFVAVLAGERRPAGFLLFKKEGQAPSPRERATRALSFSVLGYQSGSMLANIRHEVEDVLRAKLKTSRERTF